MGNSWRLHHCMSGGFGRITESWVSCTAPGHWAIVWSFSGSLGSLSYGSVGFRDEVLGEPLMAESNCPLLHASELLWVHGGDDGEM